MGLGVVRIKIELPGMTGPGRPRGRLRCTEQQRNPEQQGSGVLKGTSAGPGGFSARSGLCFLTPAAFTRVSETQENRLKLQLQIPEGRPDEGPT